jgi:hypothetical protein
MNKEDFLNSIYGSIIMFDFDNLEPKKIFLNYPAFKLCQSEILVYNYTTHILFGYEVQVYNGGSSEPEFYLGF